MQYKVGFKSDIGKKRTQNQDSGIMIPDLGKDLGFFVVADGMGGHKGGEIASGLATEKISEKFTQGVRGAEWQPVDLMTEAIRVANLAIYQRAQNDPNLQGMGTTTTALFASKNLLTIGHVGDSRCYLIQPGRIWQLTRDHSLVEERVRAGLLSRTQARQDQMKNVITRSVGFEPDLEIDIYQYEAQSGDVFLICSDGLTGMVPDEQISLIVQNHLFPHGDIPGAVQELVFRANENGGEDNVTVGILQIVD